MNVKLRSALSVGGVLAVATGSVAAVVISPQLAAAVSGGSSASATGNGAGGGNNGNGGGNGAGDATPPGKTLLVEATAVSGLRPGRSIPVPVTVTNTGGADVRLTSVSSALSTAVADALPAGCAGTDLVLGGWTAAGSGVLLAGKGGRTTVTVPLALRDTSSNQDACKSARLSIVYTATAMGK